MIIVQNLKRNLRSTHAEKIHRWSKNNRAKDGKNYRKIMTIGQQLRYPTYKLVIWKKFQTIFQFRTSF